MRSWIGLPVVRSLLARVSSRWVALAGIGYEKDEVGGGDGEIDLFLGGVLDDLRGELAGEADSPRIQEGESRGPRK